MMNKCVNLLIQENRQDEYENEDGPYFATLNSSDDPFVANLNRSDAPFTSFECLKARDFNDYANVRTTTDFYDACKLVRGDVHVYHTTDLTRDPTVISKRQAMKWTGDDEYLYCTKSLSRQKHLNRWQKSFEECDV